jgi:DNA helicase-2/ATP-dependent DNA helicase PcrA
VEQQSASYGGYGASRFNSLDTFGSSYNTPGWQRAQKRNQETDGGRGGSGGFSDRGSSFRAERRAGPQTIEGELVAKSSASSAFARGARVFHIKFGNGTIASVDGNKLTVDFDKAGRKLVLESFVQMAG